MTKERRGDATVVIHPPASFSVSGRPVLIVDDVASSGATLVETARLVAAAGAASLMVAVTHALFSEAVSARLRAAGVGTILSSDSCAHATNAIFLAPLLAEALRSETLL
jgi:ribose-phosphate pyrophosphokinase